MIKLTEQDGAAICVNPDVIETLEGTRGTVITLVTGKRFMVRESVEEVIARFIEFASMVYGSGRYPREAALDVCGRPSPGPNATKAVGDRVGRGSMREASCVAPGNDDTL